MNIIVTGASRGVGYALSKKFVSGGHRVFAAARSEEKLNDLKNECDDLLGELHAVPMDLSNRNERQKLIRLIEKAGGLDILVNNAGLLINKRIAEFSEEDFDSIYTVNVKSAFFLISELLPFLNRNAHIVNISSMGGYQGSAKFPGLSLYSSSKAALAVLTECLAEELKDQSVAVNCLALGAVQTEMLDEAFPGYKAPLNAAEMAEFIARFSLESAKYLNGKVIPVSLSTP